MFDDINELFSFCENSNTDALLNKLKLLGCDVLDVECFELIQPNMILYKNKNTSCYNITIATTNVNMKKLATNVGYSYIEGFNIGVLTIPIKYHTTFSTFINYQQDEIVVIFPSMNSMSKESFIDESIKLFKEIQL